MTVQGNTPSIKQPLLLRTPQPEDGMAVHALVANSPPLDPNSSYCNLLQCTHFYQTSVAAEQDGKLVGFISGYPIPNQPDTLFVWQVVVNQAARGQGLAGQMLDAIVQRQGNQHLQYIETTITADNAASWALFDSFAKRHNTQLVKQDFFDKQQHFNGSHASELLARIGPFNG